VLLMELAFVFIIHTTVSADVRTDYTDLQWELQKDKEGIQVYFSHIEGSEVKAFKGRTIISASASSILKVMKDAAACKDWIWGCTYASNIKEINFDEFYRYGVNHLPWPANDRDYVNHIKTMQDSVSGNFIVTIKATEGHIPPTKNVRLQKMDIEYILGPLSEFETEVTWTQHTEPGGYIPDWLVNMLLIDIPYYSLTRLEDVASSAKYRSARFVYDAKHQIIGVE
jgi:hypothetical protein